MSASGGATATARPTSRRRRTAPIAAPARIAGSPSPASPTTNGMHWRRRRSTATGSTIAASPHWSTRLQHQDALDAAVEAWTRTQDRYDCMMKLQRAGVPAGVCQNAEDRVDTDPQLRHLKWLTEVTGTKIGTWPIYELADEVQRHTGLYRRPDQPRRAVLWRGQYVGADRVARPHAQAKSSGSPRRASSDARHCQHSTAPDESDDNRSFVTSPPAHFAVGDILVLRCIRRFSAMPLLSSPQHRHRPSLV